MPIADIFMHDQKNVALSLADSVPMAGVDYGARLFDFTLQELTSFCKDEPAHTPYTLWAGLF